MLEDYRKDYSVYCLRVELKQLGKLKQRRNPETDEEVIKDLDRRMNDIRATLQLLKEKYGLIKN